VFLHLKEQGPGLQHHHMVWNMIAIIFSIEVKIWNPSGRKCIAAPKYSDIANTAKMQGLHTGLIVLTFKKIMHGSSDFVEWHFIKNFNENKLSRIATGEIWRTQSLYLLNYFIDFPCPHGCRLIHPSLICRIDFLRSVISLWITSPHRG